MDSPKTMANIIIGTYDSIGTFPVTPSAGPPQPHWKTATTTPYAAAIDSRFIAAAFSASSGARNITSNSTNAASTTTAMTTGSRFESWSRNSSWAAMLPVMYPVAWAGSSAFGSVLSDSVCNSVSVAASCGPVFGSTVPTSSAPSWVGLTGLTLATPRVEARASCRDPASDWVASAFPTWLGLSLVTTVSGAFAPGPKP